MKNFTRSLGLPRRVSRKVSESTIRRLSTYLRVLESMSSEGVPTVASEALADQVGTTAAQVRKDLSHFGSFGKRGLGYSVHELTAQLQAILGLDRRWRVALVGAGRLGSALLQYGGFASRGYDIVAVLDADPSRRAEVPEAIPAHDISKLEEVIQDERIEMVIVAVPAEAGQEVVDRAVDSGVRGVMNFAPTRLRVPDGVALKNVNLVRELEVLSFLLSDPDPAE